MSVFVMNTIILLWFILCTYFYSFVYNALDIIQIYFSETVQGL